MKRILRTKAELFSILEPHLGTHIDNELLLAIVQQFSAMTSLDADALFKTALPLLDSDLEEERAVELSYLIAGNIDRLKKGKAVHRWVGQPWEEWVAAKVIEVHGHVGKEGKKFFTATFRVVSGLAAGITFNRSFPQKYLPILAGEIGFGRSKWKTMPKELSRMLFRIKLIPGDKLNFDEYRIVDDVYNRFIIKKRRSPCPRGHTFNCTKCPVGADQCPAATHEVSYESRQCLNNHIGWFDIRHPNRQFCEACTSRRERISVLKFK